MRIKLITPVNGQWDELVFLVGAMLVLDSYYTSQKLFLAKKALIYKIKEFLLLKWDYSWQGNQEYINI